VSTTDIERRENTALTATRSAATPQNFTLQPFANPILVRELGDGPISPTEKWVRRLFPSNSTRQLATVNQTRSVST